MKPNRALGFDDIIFEWKGSRIHWRKRPVPTNGNHLFELPPRLSRNRDPFPDRPCTSVQVRGNRMVPCFRRPTLEAYRPNEIHSGQLLEKFWIESEYIAA
jgi:hypothetical protein